MQKFNRTKIVATLGPATDHHTILTEISKSGVDVCRINMSHGTHEQNQSILGCNSYGRAVWLLVNLIVAVPDPVRIVHGVVRVIRRVAAMAVLSIPAYRIEEIASVRPEFIVIGFTVHDVVRQVESS